MTSFLKFTIKNIFNLDLNGQKFFNLKNDFKSENKNIKSDLAGFEKLESGTIPIKLTNTEIM